METQRVSLAKAVKVALWIGKALIEISSHGSSRPIKICETTKPLGKDKHDLKVQRDSILESGIVGMIRFSNISVHLSVPLNSSAYVTSVLTPTKPRGIEW
jgi:hypothetical protein